MISNLSFIDDILSFFMAQEERIYDFSFTGKCLVIYFMTRNTTLISLFRDFNDFLAPSLSTSAWAQAKGEARVDTIE